MSEKRPGVALSLLFPPHRKRPHQHRQRDLRRLPPVEDGGGDGWYEEREARDAADVGDVR